MRLAQYETCAIQTCAVVFDSLGRLNSHQRVVATAMRRCEMVSRDIAPDLGTNVKAAGP